MSDVPTVVLDAAPAATPEITVSQVSVAMDGVQAQWYNEYFTGADVSDGTLTLVHYPLNEAAVLLSYQGSVQQAGVGRQFRVSGNIVQLLFTPAAGELLHFRYFAYTTAADQTWLVGTILPYHGGGAAAPPGWLLMDGATDYTKATYPLLWAWLQGEGLAYQIVASSAGTTFRMYLSTVTGVLGGGATTWTLMVKT